jgi:hypothetical protein
MGTPDFQKLDKWEDIVLVMFFQQMQKEPLA